MKKRICILLSLSMVLGMVTPVQASEVTNSIGSVKEDIANEVVTGQDTTQEQKSEYHDKITEDKEQATNIYATIASNFEVTIPKTVILDGVYKLGHYAVKVSGDISGTESISVVPDENFSMEQNNKDDVIATVTQDKTDWKFDQFNTVALGTIEAPDLTAGKWNGTFDFNINLKGKPKITVSSKDENGNDLNATATEIKGQEKDNLLASLEDIGMINSASEVDALIEVNSDEFEGMADTTFDVSNIAEEGDKVAILHFDETKQEWEYIGTETVDKDGLISTDFSSYSPVAFVKVNDDGLFEDTNLSYWKKYSADYISTTYELEYKGTWRETVNPANPLYFDTYTFNNTTGEFLLEASDIPLSSCMDCYVKYYDRYMKITDLIYQSGYLTNFRGDEQIVVQVDTYEQGAIYYGIVANENSDIYPTNGYKDGYWYIKK